MNYELREFCKRISIRANEYWSNLRVEVDPRLPKAFFYFTIDPPMENAMCFMAEVEDCDYNMAMPMSLEALNANVRFPSPVDGEDRLATAFILQIRRDLEFEGLHPAWAQKKA